MIDLIFNKYENSFLAFKKKFKNFINYLLIAKLKLWARIDKLQNENCKINLKIKLISCVSIKKKFFKSFIHTCFKQNFEHNLKCQIQPLPIYIYDHHNKAIYSLQHFFFFNSLQK